MRWRQQARRRRWVAAACYGAAGSRGGRARGSTRQQAAARHVAAAAHTGARGSRQRPLRTPRREAQQQPGDGEATNEQGSWASDEEDSRTYIIVCTDLQHQKPRNKKRTTGSRIGLPDQAGLATADGLGPCWGCCVPCL